MTRQLQSQVSLLLIALTIFSGCQATQPFYFNEDGDLSHYLDRATDFETPDIDLPHLDEVEHTEAPLTISDPEPREIWDLSLEEVVSITLNNSSVVRNLGGVTQFGFADALIGRTGSSTTIYDPAIVESDPQAGVEAALSAFDAQLNILGTNNGNFLNHTDRPSTFGFGAVVDQTTGGLRTELSKRTAGGTQVFARNITEYTRGNTILGGAQPIDSIWQTTMEVEVRQPILQGRGALVNRIPVILARINTDVSLATFESSVRNLMLDLENTYWDLHLAYRNLETARIGRDSAQTTWKTVYEKVQGGVEGIQTEQQAREQYFFFRAQLESALRDLYNTEGRLRFLMGLAATDGRLIRPIDEPTIAEVHFDWRAIHEELLIRSAELRQQKWLIQRRELELIAAKNQLLPQFDLGTSYRWFGMGDHLINADRNGLNFPVTGSTAFDELTEGNFQEAAFFMQFQMPVGFRRALSGVRNSQLSLAREIKRLEDMELNASHNLTSSVRNLDANHRIAQTHFIRLSTAVEEVETAQTLLRGGKISLDLVLDAQRRRAQAQLDYYRSVVEYNKSIADVHFRKGSILEYNNVHLSEGGWPEKAYWDAEGLARERDASYYFDYGSTRPHVISQGPVEQFMGLDYFQPETVVEPDGRPGPAEILPSVEPSPGDRMPNGEPIPEPAGDSRPKDLPEPAPNEGPKAKKGGPVTSRPDQPQLNAPLLRAEATEIRNERTAQAAPGAFHWGAFEQGAASRNMNPLRQVSHQE
jgi:outer membrane protein TolC